MILEFGSISFEMPRFILGMVGRLILRYTFKIQISPANDNHTLPLFDLCPSKGNTQELKNRKKEKTDIIPINKRT
jgi:hypothetical protein